MPERPGPWELLDQPSDPVVADLPEMGSRLAYFRSLAEIMRTQGQRLSQISSGESLKGQYADKLRSDAGTVAKDLDQVVGRYEAVVQALTGYQPALETALLGSSQALDDAIDANAAVLAADAMPTATAQPGKQLTAQQEQANTDKTTATNAAADRLNAAKQKLAGVLSALDQAGQAAAATIRKGFNDGLTDSAWDRFKYAFEKFLQILVKVLTYIGMALAVIALVIPGVGELVLAAGVALAAVTVVANIALKALGGGSWADLGMAIAGLLTFGAAKILGPAIQAGVKSLAGAIRGADAVGDAGSGAASDIAGEAGSADDADGMSAAGESKGAPDGNDEACTNGDPVDVATGDVLMTETDVSLPGLLPLVIERTHRSSWRTGRWLGRGWLSSLDQRLEVSAGRVRGAFADGRIVTWPVPSDDDAVVPESGPVWTLQRTSRESYAVHDPQRGLTWKYARPSGHYQEIVGAGEFPLAAVSDRAGHEVSFSYDASGAPEAVTHSGGYRVDVTVSDGLITALTVAGDDEPLRRYSYDEHGNLTGVTNSSGLPLRFSYDSEGRLTGWEDRNGQFYRYSYNEQGQCVSGAGPGGALSGTFSYEPGVTRWTDASGATTTYAFTESGRLAAFTDPLGHTTRREYDARGNIMTDTDPLGRVSRYAYDEWGSVTEAIRPDGGRSTVEYGSRCLPVVLASPDGSTWRQEYDERGNRTSVTGPDGSVTRFGYDEDGHLASVTAPDGSVTWVTCDAAGMPVEVTAPDGARTRYELDARGQVIRVTLPDGSVTSLGWTAEGRLASRTLPDGKTESFWWDAEGNLSRYVNAAGAVTRYEHGPFDLMTAALPPDGTRTEFGYDHALRMTEVRDGSLTWRYDYDRAGRLVAETDCNGATTTYAYDAAGQLVRQVNAASQEITFGHDLLGNLTERVTGGIHASFGYDAAGNLVWARNPDAEVRFERDGLGRVITETCNGRSVSTSFDSVGRVAGRVTSSGLATSWEFDMAGRPVTVTAAGRQLRFGYDTANRETLRELPGGLNLAQEWDQRGRLAIQSLTGPGGQIQRRSYRYRIDGILNRVDDLLTGSRSLALDPSGRVTGVTGPGWAEQYAYDQAGNIAAATWSLPSEAAASSLDSGSQGARQVTGTRVTRVGNVRYRHDAAGRVVTRTRTRISRKPETWRYGWDADGRLTSVSTPEGGMWRYLYDPFGRRVSKQRVSSDGQVLSETRYTWDGSILAEQAEATDSGERVTTWEYRPGTYAPILQAEHESVRDAPQDEIDRRFYSIITDLTGAPAELLAEDGTLAGRQQRTLWGATVWHSGGASTPLRFPGQYEDQETGLHYNNQRYYDPLTGSYLSPDPVGLEAGPNRHAYVANPYILMDPLGLMDCAASGNSGGTASRGIPTLRGDLGSGEAFVERFNTPGWIEGAQKGELPDLDWHASDYAKYFAGSKTVNAETGEGRTFIGAIDKTNGNNVIASSGGGYCAEGNALNALGGESNLPNVVFTKAYSAVVRSGGAEAIPKPVCWGCQYDIPRANFANDVEGIANGPWDRPEVAWGRPPYERS
jgi:RHS repeat-associated protein